MINVARDRNCGRVWYDACKCLGNTYNNVYLVNRWLHTLVLQWKTVSLSTVCFMFIHIGGTYKVIENLLRLYHIKRFIYEYRKNMMIKKNTSFKNIILKKNLKLIMVKLVYGNNAILVFIHFFPLHQYLFFSKLVESARELVFVNFTVAGKNNTCVYYL